MTEWDAAQYSRRSGLQAAMAAEVLAQVAFDGALRVLDVGCGEGKITAAIAARVPRGSVVGVDPSHAMIAFAAAHFGPPETPNLRFEVGDARALPYQDAFDRVVSFNALHWVPEQDAALRSLRRAMTATGRAEVRLVPDGLRASLETVVETTRRAPRWEGAFGAFRDPYLHLTPAQYTAAAERNGLRVTALQVHDKTWDFGSRAAFHAFCAMGLVAWTERLPESDRPAFVDDVLDRYRRATSAGAGEDGVFRFYQMDVTMERAPGKTP